MAMLADPRELDIMDLARPRVGQVDRWVRFMIALALGATFAVLFAGPRAMWSHGAPAGLPRFWFENALVIGFVLAIGVAAAPTTSTSRFVRIAVLLPVVQTVLMAVAWLAWQLLRHRLPGAVDSTPMFRTLPVTIVLATQVLAIAGGARLVARWRKREWLHAVLMIALVNMLLLGLWLPVASETYRGDSLEAWSTVERAFASPLRLVAYVLVPPFVGALAFTFTALRWPQIWRRNIAVFILLVLALVIAIAYRKDTTEISAFVYANFMHVLACSAIVAIGALVALGAGLWIDNVRGRRLLARDGTLTGTIVNTDACETITVSTLEIPSWLRGPKAATGAFCVNTQHGEVPVPGGVRVVAPTPISSTLLRSGEAVPTLRCGDRVTLAGYVTATNRPEIDGPFRHTSAPIPGARGITVGRIGDERYGFTHLALDLWRPSLAYLLIVAAVSLPALAALFSSRF